MPMLIPNHQSISKSIENISKTGIDIDAVVRNSLSKLSKTHHGVGYTSKPLEGSFLKTTTCMTTTPTTNTFVRFKTTNSSCKAMPLSTRNKNSVESTLGKSSRKLSKTSLLRAKIQQKKLLEKCIKKENRSNSTSEEEKLVLDDSLTSLQWLTGVKVNDLMEGKPIPYAPLSPAPSNCSDEGGDDKKFGRGRYNSDGMVDYRTNSHVKPPYSYAALIIMAMKSKSCAKMTLSEIYRWITDNFVYYKHAEPSWQNSIRHNLSLNKCFAKIPRNKGDPGKGGYWCIVPEYADKLLESNIRKRRSSMLDYGCQEFIKRQRLDMFESQLLLRIKEGLSSPNQIVDIYNNNNNTNSFNNMKNDDNNETLSNHEAVENMKQKQYKTLYNHSINSGYQQHQPSATLADAEQCRMDHPYGKNPFSRFVSDEDNIKAIADSLQRTATTPYTDPTSAAASTAQTFGSLNFDLSSSMLLNTFANAIRSDCIWSAEQNLNNSGNADLLGGSMSMVKEELLEARNLTTVADTNLTLLAKGLTSSLNSSGGFTATFCLSPPLSGDDDTLSDDLNDGGESPFDDLDLTIRGTSMTLLNPTQEMVMVKSVEQDDIKEEPLSPDSVDLHDESNEE